MGQENNINNSLSPLEQKQKTWNEKLKEMDRIVDGLGLEMDGNIKEPVAALILNGFNTVGSCGGHIEEENRIMLPWIQVAFENKPAYRYIGEKEIMQEIISKYGLKSKRDIFDGGEIEKEYWPKLDDLEESAEWKEWSEKNDELKDKITLLLEEFNRNKTDEAKLILDRAYPVWLICFDDNLLESKNFEKQKEILAETQKEFNQFANFLKRKYFSS